MSVGGDATADDLVKRLAKTGHEAAVHAARIIKCPPDFEYLLTWHADLRRAAPRMDPPQPVSWEAMAAYAGIFRLPAEPFDFDMLRRIDDIWIDCVPKPTQT